VGGSVKDTERLLGPAGFVGRTFTHNLNAGWRYSDDIRIFGGVNNVTDRDPFITSLDWPVGPRGRYFFLGTQMNF
jgi:iron complex outermembrane receptor protein